MTGVVLSRTQPLREWVSVSISNRTWFLPILAGLLVRLGASPFFGHPYDFEIWRSYSSLVWVFHVNAFFWWSQGPLSLASLIVAQAPGVIIEGSGFEISPFLENTLLHLPFVAGDLLLAYALWNLCKRYAPDWSRRVLYAWALLPGFWWISAGHGQSDPWVPATALMAIIAVLDRRWWMAGVWLGIGFGFKYVPILIVPGLIAFSWRADGRRSAGRLLGGFLVIMGLSLTPLLLTAFSLGLEDGATLLWERFNWWSVGTDPLLNPGTLVQAVYTPYPVLLGLFSSLGAPLNLVHQLPRIFVIVGFIASFGLFVLSIRRLDFRSPKDSLKHLVPLLAYAALTFLLVGGLSHVAVIQRAYWAAPLLLALAVARNSRITFGLALLYSFLVLLPEWFTTSPFFYLRTPFDEAGLSLASTLAALTGLGQSPAYAALLGALLVPFGLLTVLLPNWTRRDRTLSLPVSVLVTCVLLALIAFTPNTPLRIVLAPLSMLALAASPLAPEMRRSTVFLFAASCVVVGSVALGYGWASSLGLGSGGLR